MPGVICARACWASRPLAAAAALIMITGLAGPGTAQAAVTAAAVPTAIKLTASPRTISYDTVVSVTATVTSANGTPSGRVTFFDTSTGSNLGSATLAGGVAGFSTAALAPGRRDIVAEYGGSSAFAASRSAAVGISVGTTDDARDAQIGPAHDGYQAASALNVKNLVKKWSVSFPGLNGADLSYPVIAGGLVFISASPGARSVIYAVSQRTGKLEWTVSAASVDEMPSLSYDGGTLFSIGTQGDLSAFAAATGHLLWSRQLPRQYSFSGAPTAYDGVVYVAGSGLGGTLYAVREADGKLLWSHPVRDGDGSSPAVVGDGVYVSYACQEDYRFPRQAHASGTTTPDVTAAAAPHPPCMAGSSTPRATPSSVMFQ